MELHPALSRAGTHRPELMWAVRIGHCWGAPPAQTSTPLHLRTHTGGAPGLPGRRPPQPFLLNGKGLSGGPVKSWGGLLEPEAL